MKRPGFQGLAILHENTVICDKICIGGTPKAILLEGMFDDLSAE